MLNLLDLYYQLQHGMYFTNKITTDSYSLYYSNILNDTLWNYAVVSDISPLSKIYDDIVHDFKRVNKKPCFYISSTQTEDFKFLQDKKYRVDFARSWLRYDGKGLESKFNVRQALTEQDKEDFIKVYTEVIQENSTDKSYTNLSPAHLDVLKKSFFSPQYHHFIAYYDQLPVSIITLGIKDGYGMLCNLATSTSYRGKGYAQSVLKSAIDWWKENNGKELAVRVVHNSNAEKLLYKHNFKKVFVSYSLTV